MDTSIRHAECERVLRSYRSAFQQISRRLMTRFKTVFDRTRPDYRGKFPLALCVGYRMSLTFLKAFPHANDQNSDYKNFSNGHHGIRHHGAGLR